MRMKKTIRKRRKSHQTDYGKRLKLLKSERPRLVFRKTNSSTIVQYITSEAAQDIVVFGITSKALMKYGWPESFKGSLKSIPASYLTGFLVAKKIIKEKLDTPIIDLGMQRTLYKTRVYAFIKGVIDAGLQVNCKKEAFPEDVRISGANMKEDFTKTFELIKSNLEKL